jgi:hypothetical protein
MTLEEAINAAKPYPFLRLTNNFGENYSSFNANKTGTAGRIKKVKEIQSTAENLPAGNYVIEAKTSLATKQPLKFPFQIKGTAAPQIDTPRNLDNQTILNLSIENAQLKATIDGLKKEIDNLNSLIQELEIDIEENTLSDKEEEPKIWETLLSQAAPTLLQALSKFASPSPLKDNRELQIPTEAKSTAALIDDFNGLHPITEDLNLLIQTSEKIDRQKIDQIKQLYKLIEKNPSGEKENRTFNALGGVSMYNAITQI